MLAKGCVSGRIDFERAKLMDMEIYISKIVWAGFVALVRYGLGNRIARIISKHEEYR